MIANVLCWLDVSSDLSKARKPSQGERIIGQHQRDRYINPNRALFLSQHTLEELIALIGAHYRIAIATGTSTSWDISPAMEARWKERGIILPEAHLAGLIQDTFIAGRLAQVLEDGYSLAEMRHLARELPIARSTSLAMQAVQQRVGFDLVGGPGYRAVQTAGGLLLASNAQRVQDVVSAYRAGELGATPTNRASHTAEVVDAHADERAVSGWRALGRELRNRMGADDRARDWERVANVELRWSFNTGALGAMEEEGVTHVYFDVHKDACHHCKKLYLNRDGSPKIFLLSEIMGNVLKTGGANYGRTASAIGDLDSGWLPNALVHPSCQCRPKRVIPDVTPKARSS